MPVCVSESSPPLSARRDPEVGHQCVRVGQENVLGLDVAVNDAVPMRVVEGTGYLASDADGVLERELSLVVQSVAKGLAFDKQPSSPWP